MHKCTNTLVPLADESEMYLSTYTPPLFSTGKGPYLYRHELIGLHNRHLHKFSLPMNKIPEKFLPRKYAITNKVCKTPQ